MNLVSGQNTTIKVTNLVDYFSGHQEMDIAYQWGLRYQEGSQ